MKVHATIDLSDDLYLSLSAFGLTKEKIASESRKLLAVKLFREKLLSFGKAAARVSLRVRSCFLQMNPLLCYKTRLGNIGTLPILLDNLKNDDQ